MKKSLIQWMGLLGILSLISYTAAVVISPIEYPGYQWMAQAVSDLSAANAPSRELFQRLNCLNGIGGIVSCMMICVFIQGKLNRFLRIGIYLFTLMNWISLVGYTCFPLTDSGYAGTFQDIMHLVTTVVVVLLSILSLVFVMIGGYRKKYYISLAVWASVALFMMMFGSIMSGAAPVQFFGIFERFSVFAAAGFQAVLGCYLYRGFER